MDSIPIHKHEDVARHVADRGYICIYFSLYFPELNPIEQFCKTF